MRPALKYVTEASKLLHMAIASDSFMLFTLNERHMISQADAKLRSVLKDVALRGNDA